MDSKRTKEGVTDAKKGRGGRGYRDEGAAGRSRQGGGEEERKTSIRRSIGRWMRKGNSEREGRKVQVSSGMGAWVGWALVGSPCVEEGAPRRWGARKRGAADESASECASSGLHANDRDESDAPRFEWGTSRSGWGVGLAGWWGETAAEPSVRHVLPSR